MYMYTFYTIIIYFVSMCIYYPLYMHAHPGRHADRRLRTEFPPCQKLRTEFPPSTEFPHGVSDEHGVSARSFCRVLLGPPFGCAPGPPRTRRPFRFRRRPESARAPPRPPEKWRVFDPRARGRGSGRRAPPPAICSRGLCRPGGTMCSGRLSAAALSVLTARERPNRCGSMGRRRRAAAFSRRYAYNAHTACTK